MRHLNHLEFQIESNSMAYKLVDPPIGMCANPYTTHSSPRGMCYLDIETIPNYKPIDPLRGMCQSIHYPFTIKSMCLLGIETILDSHWHFTLFITFQVICYFHSQSQPLASSTILATCTIKLHFPPLLLISLIYTWICIYSMLIA